ncbi:SapC family protein [Altericroceibacterium xinjiangense]|uniref:SapC family protein n=1 Tax=Altericroceibacterium xinjiangense TaxID=762261 RepID=UPI000F7E4555|nr:SapC family protein [Altericroceibacterium xinjiangense]
MASAPQASLPLFYQDLLPLNSRDHAAWRARATDRAPWAAKQNAIPLTVDEFIPAQRNFPIVFSSGENPVPLALFGLNDGVNVFFDDEGKALEDFYVPAYIRRYPFLLAKLRTDSDDMSLCFDPKSGLVGEFEDGTPLFEGTEPTQNTKELLEFCQRFEEAGARTQQFVDELKKHGLFMEGEVSIQRNSNPGQPFVYRGFQIVNQEKLRELRGDQLRSWNQNGLLPLLFAHLYSLELMSTIFGKQNQQGKGPSATATQGEVATEVPASE